MTRHANRNNVSKDQEIPVQVKLAAAWAGFLFLCVYVDILSFYFPGVIDDILAGVVWEFQISQTWAVGALTLMAIPILMIVLSMTLPARANRRANLAVASIFVVISFANVLGESWMYFFGLSAVLEVGILALILREAWAWPRTHSDAADVATADRLRQGAHI